MTETRGRLGITYFVAVALAAAILASIGIHVQNELNGLTPDEGPRGLRPSYHVNTYDPKRGGERLRLFNKQLHISCDLTSTSMRWPRIWLGRCPSGEELLLIFKRDGTLEGAANFVALTASQSPADKKVRRRLFDAQLRELCDVISTHMESPNVWTANCQTGRRFTLRFEEGHLGEWIELR